MTTEVKIRPNPGPQFDAFACHADILIYGGGAGGGKLLRVDEPIATPTGWTTMGEIAVGDTVFDADGAPCKVTWVSAVDTQPDAWRLTFCDGTSIECDADHQWLVLDYAQRKRLLQSDAEWRAKRRLGRPSRAAGTKSKAFTASIAARNSMRAKLLSPIPDKRGSVVTTREIVEQLHVRGRINFCVVSASPLRCDHLDLPVDPYVLGAWLGDGTSREGGFTSADPQVWQEIESAGYEVTHSPSNDQAHYVRGLVQGLRAAGVLGNKHIPQCYLRSSVEQRLALLQGLCDTDGCVTASGGVEFTTTSAQLRDGFAELLASLGIKSNYQRGEAKLDGRYISDKWRFKFVTDLQAFRLERKSAKQKRFGFRGVHVKRFIVSAEPCDPTPMRCISVDSPTSTYLATKAMIPTHNTWFLVAEPLRFKDDPHFRCAIFRRTYPQITGQGGIWDEANELYPKFGGKLREGNELDCKFPSGASVRFCHMQHEKDKYNYQGQQMSLIEFDELTHFTETQFFYMLSRNRSKANVKEYIRATCNPDGGSWVADFIGWWIDQDTGLAIRERCGVLRYFTRQDMGDGEKLYWADTRDELLQQFPELEEHEILSVTFIEAAVEDNPHLDKSYVAKLKALPKIERDRLLGRNWKTREGAIIDGGWFKPYWINSDKIRFSFQSQVYEVPLSACRRFATIDTAGTSKEKAATKRGDPPSWSVCGVWDWIPSLVVNPNNTKVTLTQMLFLRHVYRKQVDWNELKIDIPEVLSTWHVQTAYIENAHHGQPLKAEIRTCQVELVGPTLPGMGDSSDGAKLERAIASGFLTILELGKVFFPADTLPWLQPLKRELTVWTGLPKETADQIDMCSYAAYVSRTQRQSWGGTVPHLVNKGQMVNG